MHDLLAARPYTDLWAASQGRLRAICGGPNCKTWSILRWYPKPGAPVPVRGRDPTTCWGLPDNTHEEQAVVEADSILLLRLMFLQSLAARAARLRGLNPPATFLEHSSDPQSYSAERVAQQCSSIWALPLRRLAKCTAPLGADGSIAPSHYLVGFP